MYKKYKNKLKKQLLLEIEEEARQRNEHQQKLDELKKENAAKNKAKEKKINKKRKPKVKQLNKMLEAFEIGDQFDYLGQEMIVVDVEEAKKQQQYVGSAYFSCFDHDQDNYMNLWQLDSAIVVCEYFDGQDFCTREFRGEQMIKMLIKATQ